MNNNITSHDITQFMEVPLSFNAISQPKSEITDSIKKAMEINKLTVRKLADLVGMKHPQIIRITSGENYNIETLLKILDALNLEIIIKEKTDKDNLNVK